MNLRYRKPGQRTRLGLGRIVEDTKREDELVQVMTTIAGEAGAHAPLLIALIHKRARNISAIEAANYILGEWRKGGDDRDRLLTHSRKSDAELRTERHVAHELWDVLAPFANARFDNNTRRLMVKALTKTLQSRAPWISKSDAKDLAESAILLRENDIIVQTDAITRAITNRPKASAGAH